MVARRTRGPPVGQTRFGLAIKAERLDTAPVPWHDHQMQNMLAGLLFVALVTAELGVAQTNGPGRTVWDGVYTEAQAARGVTAYAQSCARCHALAAAGNSPLVGDSFWKSFSQKNVGDVFQFVSANMPNGAPGSLSETAYEDIVAVLLKSNGFPAGTVALNPATIADVQIVPKDGRTELPANALVRVVGCLTRRGADWVITSATTPERAERIRAAEEDAAATLGNSTMALKFVVTRLDAMAGSRVLVNGLLLGDGGVDGINVTTVKRVAPKCP